MSPTSQEDPFKDKRKLDREDLRKAKVDKVPFDKDKSRPKGENEMDLINEQSKKQVLKDKEKLKRVGDTPAPTKYFRDQEGFVQFPDGSRYKGPLIKGNPDGLGIIFYGDGSKYEGSWEEGNAHGYGILTFQDLSRYEGHWFKGKYHG